MTWLEKINQNPIWVFVLAVLGIIGFIFGIWSHIRSKSRKQLVWNIRYNTLVDNSKSKFPEMQVLFSGQPISSLTSTYIMIQNNGNVAVRDTDFVDQIQLLIKPKNDDVKILNAQLVDLSEEQKKSIFDPEVIEKNINVRFSHIKKKDSFVVQVLHTKGTLEVKCDIIDGSFKINKAPGILFILGSAIAVASLLISQILELKFRNGAGVPRTRDILPTWQFVMPIIVFAGGIIVTAVLWVFSLKDSRLDSLDKKPPT